MYACINVSWNWYVQIKEMYVCLHFVFFKGAQSYGRKRYGWDFVNSEQGSWGKNKYLFKIQTNHFCIQLNWGQFFTKIQNSDYKASALEATADYLVMAYDFVINPPKDSMMSKVTTWSKSFESNIFHQAPVLINGLLVSQRLPTIDMKNPVDSLTKVQLWTKPNSPYM